MEQNSQKFLTVMKGLMRPLVRTLIARGVTAPAFYKLLKSVYVEVARDEFRIAEEPPTDSRITLLTGVHRRDVRAILSDDDDSWDTARAKTATFATVIGQWMARPDYNDADGQPKALPRGAEDGASFEALVRSINTDIRPRTVLDELLRQGLVVEADDGLLRISDKARQGPASDDDRLVFFAANVGDHIAAATENLLSDAPPFFERAVFYNQLPADAVDQVEARARDLSQGILETLNDETQALRAAADPTTPGAERYRLGIYFYRETGDPDPEPTKEDGGEDN
jgi:hypothetical protein